MPDIRKCFEILGVQPGATEIEIKEALRDLVKVWHPDRFDGDPRLQLKAQEKLKEINEAYEAVRTYSLLLRKKAPDHGTASDSTRTGSGEHKSRDGDVDNLVDRLKRGKKEKLPEDDAKKVAQAIAMMIKEERRRK